VFEDIPDHKVGVAFETDRVNEEDADSDEESDWNTDLKDSAESNSDCSFVTYQLSHITEDNNKSAGKDSLLNTLFSGTSIRPQSRNVTSAHLFQKQLLSLEDLLAKHEQTKTNAPMLSEYSVPELSELITHLQWSRIIENCHIHPEMLSSQVFHRDLRQHRLDPLHRHVTDIGLHLRQGDEVALFATDSAEVSVAGSDGELVVLSPGRLLVLAASDVSRHLTNCTIFEDSLLPTGSKPRAHRLLFVESLLTTIELEYLALEILSHIGVPYSVVHGVGFRCVETGTGHRIDGLLFMQRYKDTAELSPIDVDILSEPSCAQHVECFYAARSFAERAEQLYELVKFAMQLSEKCGPAGRDCLGKANHLLAKLLTHIFMSSVNISSFSFVRFPPKYLSVGSLNECDEVYFLGHQSTVESPSLTEDYSRNRDTLSSSSSSIISTSNSSMGSGSGFSSSDPSRCSDPYSSRSSRSGQDEDEEEAVAISPPDSTQHSKRPSNSKRLTVRHFIPEVQELLACSGDAFLSPLDRAELKVAVVLLLRVGRSDGGCSLTQEDRDAVATLLPSSVAAYLAGTVDDLLLADSFGPPGVMLCHPAVSAAWSEVLTILLEESAPITVKPADMEVDQCRVIDICLQLLTIQCRRSESIQLCKRAVLHTSEFSETDKCISYCKLVLEFLTVPEMAHEWNTVVYVSEILVAQYQKFGEFENAMAAMSRLIDKCCQKPIDAGTEFTIAQQQREHDALRLKLYSLQMQCGKLSDASVGLQDLYLTLCSRGGGSWEQDKIAVLSWLVEAFMKLGNSDRCRKLLVEMKVIRQNMSLSSSPGGSHLKRQCSDSSLSRHSSISVMRLDSNLPRHALAQQNIDFGELTARWFFSCKMFVSALKSLVPTLMAVELAVSHDSNRSHDKLKELGRLYYLRGKIQLGAAVSGKVKFPFSVGSSSLFTAVSLLFQVHSDNAPRLDTSQKHNSFFSKYYRRKDNASDSPAQASAKPSCKHATRYFSMPHLVTDAAKWFKKAWDIFREVSDLLYAAKAASYVAKSQLQAVFVLCAYDKVPIEVATEVRKQKQKKKKRRAPPRLDLTLDLDLDLVDDDKAIDPSASSLYLMDIERALAYGKETILASRFPVEVIDFSLSQAELRLIQGRIEEAVAMWQEARELFCSLFTDGVAIPLLSRISISDSQKLYALVSRLTRFLLACDKTIINENIVMIDIHVNMSFDMERRHRRCDTSAKIVGALYEERESCSNTAPRRANFSPSDSMPLRALEHMPLMESYPSEALKGVIACRADSAPSEDEEAGTYLRGSPILILVMAAANVYVLADDANKAIASAKNVLEDEDALSDDDIFALGAFDSCESSTDYDRRSSWKSAPNESLRRVAAASPSSPVAAGKVLSV
jgi:hypothetical protein